MAFHVDQSFLLRILCVALVISSGHLTVFSDVSPPVSQCDEVKCLSNDLCNQCCKGEGYQFGICGKQDLMQFLVKTNPKAWCKEKYKERLIEVKQQATQDDTEGYASTCISDNEVYLQVVKKNTKGNLYGLVGLTDDFIRSTLPQSSMSQPSPVTVGVIEEMKNRITKLNVELAAKEAKEKALEEHIRQHDEQMQYM
ncbi:uncharacterized protein LOC109798977 isoform X2 [Cajanus cajan]|uniref:uncharacterized protein LOC109798977 isoform X1 n=1 Tax=Cajanus cajan TaxID=3821 RepID=UPI00098D7E7E|nr:uncharacterized protein LOC109798977 isoform X1 [Cajanus cajan]XP_020215027.1 uncharacterized protein LOC109798977 isoform X2 [Cajanus cajan]